MFGIFGRLIDFMVEVILFLYGIVPSYGLAIILFTIAIKMLLLPLMIKQTKSMKAMQDLQPQMKEIKDKYDDDKEKQQEEMMKLYQENNVNPIAGCLPLVVQMAIIIPLFRAIHQLEEVAPGFEEASFLWIGRITDGSLAERDIILIVLTGLVMLAQSKITQSISGGGGGSSKIMYFMPLFIIFIGFQLPSAVMIYILVASAFSVFQQYYVKREPNEPEQVAEEAQ